jgi:hypothetical protein
LPEEPVRRAHALVELARGQRGLHPPVDPDDDRVPDPMGGTGEDHHRAAVLIREAVSDIVDIVAPARPPVGPLRRPSPTARPAAGPPGNGSRPLPRPQPGGGPPPAGSPRPSVPPSRHTG